MTTVHYTVPKEKIYSEAELDIWKSILHETITVTGELTVHPMTTRPALVFTSHLLPGNPSIFNMSRVATYLATEYGFIVQFEFNGHEYSAYPNQKEEDIIRLYHVHLCSLMHKEMTNHIVQLEKELQAYYTAEEEREISSWKT